MGGVTTTAGTPDSRCILLTDIYQSSRLSEAHPQQYSSALRAHNTAVEKAVGECAGLVYKNTGDGYIAFFDRAADCLACAARLQQEFSAFPPFGDDDPFLVRLVAHGGVLRAIGSEYYGPALNRTSRICQVCHPGQVLVSDAVAAYVDQPADDAALLDLGEHHLRDLAEPVHLYQLDHDGFARREFPPLPTLGNRPNNLVEQPNAFIGRRDELDELKAMLLNGKRLVTITAPGGYGKSRLAAHLCADLLTAFDRGVYFVELAPVRDNTGITTALANATGFQFDGTREPKQQLSDYLRAKEMLLCFDNFEHVLEGASFIGDILKEAPRVKVAVTSREPLRIQGEQVYALQPLPVERQETQEHSDSVLLFADRAGLVSPGFGLSEESLLLVRDICARLSGIPLAIELAAAWVDSFTLGELLAELDQQLELTARLRDVPDRHRSLRACMDWSWNLLGEEQRRMLMQLSTFRGGCFVEAAAAVVGVTGMQLRTGLATLCDKSWMYTREVDGKTRFFMRDAASRAYAFEKLVGTRRDAESLYELSVGSHAAYFSALVEREGGRLSRHGQLEALRTFRLEYENIIEAKDTLLARFTEQHALLLPIIRRLKTYLVMDSRFDEVLVHYEQLDAAVRTRPELWIHTLFALAGAYRRQGHYPKALKLADAAMGLAKTSDDPRQRAVASTVYGSIWTDQGRYSEAMKCYAESLAIYRAIGWQPGEASALRSQSQVYRTQGKLEEAKVCLEKSHAVSIELGDLEAEGLILNTMGLIHRSQGKLEEAKRCFEQSLAIKRQFGSLFKEGIALYNIGGVYFDQGELRTCLTYALEATRIIRRLGYQKYISLFLIGLGDVHRELNELAEARECYFESLAISRDIGSQSLEAICLGSLADLQLILADLEAALSTLTRAEKLCTEMQDQENLGLVHARWAKYHIAAARQDSGGNAQENLAAACRQLAKSEACAEQMGAGAKSDLGQEITRARQDVMAFAEEHGLSEQVNDLLANRFADDPEGEHPSV